MDEYDDRLAEIEAQLSELADDMTLAYRHGDGVPQLGHVKVLQAIVQVTAARKLLRADRDLRRHA